MVYHTYTQNIYFSPPYPVSSHDQLLYDEQDKYLLPMQQFFFSSSTHHPRSTLLVMKTTDHNLNVYLTILQVQMQTL